MNFIFIALLSTFFGCAANLETGEQESEKESPIEAVEADVPIETPDSPTDTSSADTGLGSCDTAGDSPIDWETCSFNIGEHICNVTLKDVDAIVHEFYSYYGRPMVIQLSAEWCSPCHTAGTYAESYMQTYSAENLLWITIILENSAGEPATQTDLAEWEAEMSTVDALTLAGSRELIDLSAQAGFPVSSWPTFVVVNSDMTIYHGFYGWSESYLTSVLDTMLGR